MMLYLPTLVAAAIGSIFLTMGEAKLWMKMLVVAVFAFACLLQFRGTTTAAWIAGFLTQVILAIGLSLWMKFRGPSGLDV
jgi:hypothetical protein